MKSYIIYLYLPKPCRIKAGALGEIEFEPGYYLYAGSGGKNLLKRVQRHLRKEKKVRWHIDYITTSGFFKIISVYTTNLSEHELVKKIIEKGGNMLTPVPGFGASDSPFKSHLFYSRKCVKHLVESIGSILTL